jgi:hypothetical protein
LTLEDRLEWVLASVVALAEEWEAASGVEGVVASAAW